MQKKPKPVLKLWNAKTGLAHMRYLSGYNLGFT